MFIGIGFYLFFPRATWEYAAGEEGLYHKWKIVFRTDEKILFVDNSKSSTKIIVGDYTAIVINDKLRYFWK